MQEQKGVFGDATTREREPELQAEPVLGDDPGENAEKMVNENAMNVVMVGAEMAPWSKTGRLAGAPKHTTAKGGDNSAQLRLPH